MFSFYDILPGININILLKAKTLLIKKNLELVKFIFVQIEILTKIIFLRVLQLEM